MFFLTITIIHEIWQTLVILLTSYHTHITTCHELEQQMKLNRSLWTIPKCDKFQQIKILTPLIDPTFQYNKYLPQFNNQIIFYKNIISRNLKIYLLKCTKPKSVPLPCKSTHWFMSTTRRKQWLKPLSESSLVFIHVQSNCIPTHNSYVRAALSQLHLHLPTYQPICS